MDNEIKNIGFVSIKMLRDGLKENNIIKLYDFCKKMRENDNDIMKVINMPVGEKPKDYKMTYSQIIDRTDSFDICVKFENNKLKDFKKNNEISLKIFVNDLYYKGKLSVQISLEKTDFMHGRTKKRTQFLYSPLTESVREIKESETIYEYLDRLYSMQSKFTELFSEVDDDKIYDYMEDKCRDIIPMKYYSYFMSTIVANNYINWNYNLQKVDKKFSIDDAIYLTSYFRETNEKCGLNEKKVTKDNALTLYDEYSKIIEKIRVDKDYEKVWADKYNKAVKSARKEIKKYAEKIAPSYGLKVNDIRVFYDFYDLSVAPDYFKK